MPSIREIYRHNHGHIRGLARFESTPGRRDKKINSLCMDRAFWLGDKYSAPATPGARAALIALRDRTRQDTVQAVIDVFGLPLNSHELRAATMLRKASYIAYRPGRLPA